MSDQPAPASVRYFKRKRNGDLFRVDAEKVERCSNPHWILVSRWPDAWVGLESLIETDEHGTALALAATPDLPGVQELFDHAPDEEDEPPADAPAKDAGETPRVDAMTRAREFCESIAHETDYGVLSRLTSMIEKQDTLEREAAALRDRLSWIHRFATKSADIMRDPARTVGWTGADSVSRQFGEIASKAALADGKGEKPCAGA